MPFLYHRPLRFADTDMAGVGHFAAILTIVEEAWHAWLQHLGECVHPAHAPDGAEPVGWPIVSLSADFAKPVRFGDEITAALTIEHLGTRSIRLHFALQANQHEFAAGSVSTACTHLDSAGHWQSRPVPAALAKKLTANT